MSKLYTPVKVGRYALSHRVALAPMTRLRTIQPGDIPSSMMADFYGQRASEGGLEIIEGVSISVVARSYLGAASFFHDGQFEGWKAIADAVHAKGGIVFMQLIHGGRQSHVEMTGGVDPVAPSVVPFNGVALTKDGFVPASPHRALAIEEIPAASSSVGLAAIQIATYAGATPIALTRTSEKKQQLLDAGAAHVIATTEVDLVEEVMRITGGVGARVAFDPVGGETLAKLISALSFQGVVYLYGALAEEPTRLPVLAMIAKMPIIKGQNIWLTSGDETRRKAAIAYVTKGLESGALKPIIDRIFPFDDIVEAHRYLEQNGQFGKIVVTV